ncbi:(2Fe-2S)-binding protein [Bailinhaonella thermotolerans]|uniref:Bacterioferritin-associated ferredoxin n=1 Tax=Bailinhaonella thermotolerans TaxID=1070861 RepID=A0A3A4BR09_9ACTN|nr:(2Fe-2S)-binding protein [Bailinhaonella thermotolerans]RJL33576.1 (2Fe-2S)-binding protein [Bailinhaonella thermotolerans]
MYVCICHAVTENEVADCIADGAETPDDIGDACGAGTGCGSCVMRICEILKKADSLVSTH